jgi:crotonobetainyl-CoA:carnitine CoA-transferase CaiB-like acyl-CoA transferase
MAGQRVDDLYHRGQAARLCISPVNTMAQLAADRHLADRGFFAELPDGRTVPGAGFHTDRAWWAIRRPAPARGEHDGEGWAARPAPTAPPVAVALAAPGTSPGRPLDGIRVCDFTWIWAGPYCTQILAHLGADVIRLESPEHECLFRRLPFNPTELPLGPDTSGLFQIYNSDKRSLRIDLRHPDAADIVRRLVAVSDVVVENFAVGTMDKLGFGLDELRRINPDVVVASLSGYGQDGPSADYMAYGPAGGAVAGLYAATGYEGGDPAETGIAVGDPCTGITAAWAIVAALAARRRSGEVARVDVAMVEAVAATIGEVWMEYLAEGRPPGPLGNHDPQWSPHSCYPAAGEDRWVTIGCPDEASWRALCGVADPAWLDDARFATAADRKANEAALDELIGGWTSALDRWDVTHRLQAAGVAAFPSLSPLDLWSGDPQLAAIGMLERPEHPVGGRRVVPGIPWRLHNGPNGLRRPAPRLGEHTEEILLDLLGYHPEQVAHLAAVGALP